MSFGLPFYFFSTLLVIVLLLDTIFLSAYWLLRIHEHAVLVQVVVYALESVHIFLMDRLWIQVLEEFWVEPFCKVWKAPNNFFMFFVLPFWLLSRCVMSFFVQLGSGGYTNTPCLSKS